MVRPSRESHSIRSTRFKCVGDDAGSGFRYFFDATSSSANLIESPRILKSIDESSGLSFSTALARRPRNFWSTSEDAMQPQFETRSVVGTVNRARAARLKLAVVECARSDSENCVKSVSAQAMMCVFMQEQGAGRASGPASHPCCGTGAGGPLGRGEVAQLKEVKM